MKSPYIFISYKSEEFDESNWVKSQLENAGIACWMAPESIPGGSNYALQIPRAIRDCSVFVLILSSKAQTSEWVTREVDRAISMKKVVLPFCIEDCSLRDNYDFYFSTVQRYNAWNDRKQSISSLISDLQNRYLPMNPSLQGYSYVSEALTKHNSHLVDNSNNSSSGRNPNNRSNNNSRKIRKENIKRANRTLLYIIAGGCVLLLLFVTILASKKNTKPDSNIPDSSDKDITTDSTKKSPIPVDETKYNTNGTVRILNQKYAQSFDFERLAARFHEESGIKVSVESPPVGTYSEVLNSEITGSNSDPTLFMLSGPSDFDKFGFECLELSDTDAKRELVDDTYTLRGQNGKVYGLACIVEAYGLIVNTRLLAKAGYTITEIQSFSDLQRIVKDITSRKDELGFSAFTSPSVGGGISGDYRFAEHAPSVPLYYEIKDNDFNIGMDLRGTYLDRYQDFIDLYLDNSTVSRKEAINRSLEDAQKDFLMDKAVFHQDGSWSTDDIKSIIDDQAAVIPLYMGIPGEENQGINETISYYWCVNKYASEDDIEATLQFLYWTVSSEAGIRIMTQDMGFQIPYKNASVPDNIFLETLHTQQEQGYETIKQYYKYGDYTLWSSRLKTAIERYTEDSASWKDVESAYTLLW